MLQTKALLMTYLEKSCDHQLIHSTLHNWVPETHSYPFDFRDVINSVLFFCFLKLVMVSVGQVIWCTVQGTGMLSYDH